MVKAIAAKICELSGNDVSTVDTKVPLLLLGLKVPSARTIEELG